MKANLRSVLLWGLAIVLTSIIVIYQRKTGPTYPVTGTKVFQDMEIPYKFLTSYGEDENAPVILEIPDTSVCAKIKYKRFKSFDDWAWIDFKREGNKLYAHIPKQPPAGKVIYNVIVFQKEKSLKLNDEPIIIRFKGKVPDGVLIAHVVFMLLSMFFSTRTGLSALFKELNTYRYTYLTLVFLFLGGLIFGPIVQKYAFGAFWTGWPLGHDLTDNKTIVAFIFWVIAFIRMSKTKKAYGWVIAASIILLAIYLIPHSLLGSEIDYTKIPQQP